MAYSLIGTKPLPKPMQTYNLFQEKKWKGHLQYGGHFGQVPVC